MRIALVTDTFTPQVNGVTTVLRRMVEAIGAAEEQVAVVAPRYSATPDGHASRVPELRVRSLPFPPYPDIRLSIPPYRRARRFLGDFAPDIVHVATEGPLGLLGRRYAVRSEIPLVTSFHTDFPRYTRDYGVGALEPLVWRWLTWFHGPAHLTHTPGDWVRGRLQDKGISRAVTWGRGVDVRAFDPALRDVEWRRRHQIAEKATIVVHVGRLAFEKNLDVLIDSWMLARQALGEQAVFLLVGDGPMAYGLSRRAPWARRLGFLDRQELARDQANSDICFLPSSTETCGLVALEAMASGIPVIAADAGGFRESVRHGENGFLAPPESSADFARAIVRLAGDEALRRSLALTARRTAEERDISIEDAELLQQYRDISS